MFKELAEIESKTNDKESISTNINSNNLNEANIDDLVKYINGGINETIAKNKGKISSESLSPNFTKKQRQRLKKKQQENKKDKSKINLKEITESESVDISGPTVLAKQQEMHCKNSNCKNDTPSSTGSLNLIIENEKSNKINKKTKKIKVCWIFFLSKFLIIVFFLKNKKQNLEEKQIANNEDEMFQKRQINSKNDKNKAKYKNIVDTVGNNKVPDIGKSFDLTEEPFTLSYIGKKLF